MPRLGNQLKDISTVIEPPNEGVHTVLVATEDAKSKSKKDMTVFTFTIQGGDFDGRELKEYCVLQKNTGEVNTAGLRQIKRICEPLVGERVNEDDFDTAEVNDMVASVYIKHETYRDDTDLDENGEPREKVTGRVARVIGPA